jgi:exopolysaccharide biosynthesis polyprenyl glycosylphosphotransferase
MLQRDTSTGYAITAITAPPEDDVDSWVETVVDCVAEQRIDAVMLAPDTEVTRAAVRALAWRLGGSGTDLLVSPTLGDLAGPRSITRSASRLPLIHLDEARLTGPQQVLKRTGDVLAASIGLLVMLPVLLLVALAVKLTSRGPVLFRQQRVGRDGRTFVIAKFRTMVDGAHLMHDEVLGPPVGRTAEITASDPRITPLGRFLRRWSLDEFPQLWSVITGDMSLVGPRPLMPEEMPWLEPLGQRRHLMRPGITGLWQVNGRKEVDWADRIRLDIDYVERWSPLIDTVLLLRTIKAVITGTGAH